MRGVCWTFKMGLFLHAVGSVSPTESAADRSLLQCEGVNNQSYTCESGHCCGESQCCSYYYELWWFWLVWAIIFILSCCCVCHHRRTKHRLQQQQRQHEINLIAYREAHNYPTVPFYFRFLPNYLLPDYEEVVNRPPTPPPPYSALHSGPTTVVSSALASEQQDSQAPPLAPVSDTLSCHPTEEEPHTPASDFRPKPDNKEAQTAPESDVILASDGDSGDSSCKDPPDSAEDKERLPNGRRRRFTGDSGIEVCGCSGAGGTGQEGKELRELESLLGCNEEDEEAGDFCDGCGHRASFTVAEEESPSADRRPHQPTHLSGNLPVCLHLHTISEQEGGLHSTSTEPQG